MASTLDFEPYLRWWVAQRCPGLAGKVKPSAEQQGATGVHCTYTRVSGGRVRSLSDGPSGVSRVRVQVDVWSQRRDEARGLADKIAGNREDPGLDGFAGLVGDPGTTLAPLPRVYVQSSEASDNPEGYTRGEHAADAGWYQCSRDYAIWFEELLRTE